MQYMGHRSDIAAAQLITRCALGCFRDLNDSKAWDCLDQDTRKGDCTAHPHGTKVLTVLSGSGKSLGPMIFLPFRFPMYHSRTA